MSLVPHKASPQASTSVWARKPAVPKQHALLPPAKSAPARTRKVAERSPIRIVQSEEGGVASGVVSAETSVGPYLGRHREARYGDYSFVQLLQEQKGQSHAARYQGYAARDRPQYTQSFDDAAPEVTGQALRDGARHYLAQDYIHNEFMELPTYDDDPGLRYQLPFFSPAPRGLSHHGPEYWEEPGWRTVAPPGARMQHTHPPPTHRRRVTPEATVLSTSRPGQNHRYWTPVKRRPSLRCLNCHELVHENHPCGWCGMLCLPDSVA